MEIERVRTHSSFEVFDSGDGWEFLFRKPLLAAFNAIDNYRNDTVVIGNKGVIAKLINQLDAAATMAEEVCTDRKLQVQENTKGNKEMFPSREVPTGSHIDNEQVVNIPCIEHKEEKGTIPVTVDPILGE